MLHCYGLVRVQLLSTLLIVARLMLDALIGVRPWVVHHAALSGFLVRSSASATTTHAPVVARQLLWQPSADGLRHLEPAERGGEGTDDGNASE